MNQGKSLPSATVIDFVGRQQLAQHIVFGSLRAKGVIRGASEMGTTQAPAQRPLEAGRTGTILIVTGRPERYSALPGNLEFIAHDVAAICAAAAHGDAYRAVIAEVNDPDGREVGYRIAQLLRTQFMLLCPIFLTTAKPTACAKAYAIQCGATKLMRDDDDLVEDLLHLGLAEATPSGDG